MSVIVTTPGGQCYFLVAYPKQAWDRGPAWGNLLNQKIPGCPKPLILKDNGQQIWGHGWVKAHTETEWAWVYWNFPQGRQELYGSV